MHPAGIELSYLLPEECSLYHYPTGARIVLTTNVECCIRSDNLRQESTFHVFFASRTNHGVFLFSVLSIVSYRAASTPPCVLHHTAFDILWAHYESHQSTR